MYTLSLIVPTYNEARTVGTVLTALTALTLPGWEKQIIVVDDGSTDEIKAAVAPFLPSIAYLRHERNRGKGAAIRTALREVVGEAVLIQDADLEYLPEDIPALLAALCAENVDAVYGSRTMHTHGNPRPHYALGARLLTALVNACFGSRLSDVYTGYKLIRTPLLKNLHLTATGFEWEMELTARLLKQNCRIVEVPIHYSPRGFDDGKKIRARDGLTGLLTLAQQYLRE